MTNYLTPFEAWQDIPGFEGLYQINRTGEIKSCSKQVFRKIIGVCVLKERILSPKTSLGYKRVTLTNKQGKQTCLSVHRLVGLTFIPNPENFPCINHKNSIRDDNRVENLEWCSFSYNNSHAFKSGFQVPNRPMLGRKNELAPSAKAVIQKDRLNNFIKKFPTAKQADEATGVSFSLISACCRGKSKTGGGFIWEFEKKEII